MRFAEVFLRLGCALVAWMLLYAYFVWLAVLYVIGCGPDGDELHRLLLGFAPLAIGAALLIRATRPFPEIHSMLRWLGVPLGLLLMLALRGVWAAIRDVNLAGGALCTSGAPTAWQLAWGPAQVMTLAIATVLIILEIKRSH